VGRAIRHRLHGHLRGAGLHIRSRGKSSSPLSADERGSPSAIGKTLRPISSTFRVINLWTRRAESPEGVAKSFEYYQRAIEKDPNFALAYVGMAESYLTLSLTSYAKAQAKEIIPKAVANMTVALELDPTLA